MSDHSSSQADPQAFELDAAYEILDRAQLMLARMIPECTPRRYEPPVRTGGGQVLLCLAETGPIAPILTISPMKYGTLGQAHIWYGLAVWRDGLRQGFTFPYVLGCFTGIYLKGLVQLDTGAEAIAQSVHAALSKYDLQAIVALERQSGFWQAALHRPMCGNVSCSPSAPFICADTKRRKNCFGITWRGATTPKGAGSGRRCSLTEQPIWPP